jgi:hypothetical protein
VVTTVPPTRDVPSRIFTGKRLSHFTACTDGLRVYDNEGSFEPVFTKSLDAFMWALVHHTAVGRGTYDAAAYTASVKKLKLLPELELK